MNNWTLAKENQDPIVMMAAPQKSNKASRLQQQKSVEKEEQLPASPTNGKSCDLFELLERCQSQRLDDQRCQLPSYFSQVSFYFSSI